MPEGHTLHALARDLGSAFAGAAPAVSSPQGRFAAGAALLDGHRVDRAQAWGKLLFVDFEGDRTLYVHLGLIGRFTVLRLGADSPAPPVQGAVRLRLLGAGHVADLRGPMACEVVSPEDVDRMVSRLGPDPLRADADPDLAWARLHRSRKSVAELLMDQSVVAGVGNLYRCEVLFRHRVGPWFPGTRIKRQTWQAVWEDLVRLMPVGVSTGRIVTRDEVLQDVADAVAAGHDPGGLDIPRDFNVYRRTGEPCLRCGSRIRTAVVAGRNLFWCGNCQRRT